MGWGEGSVPDATLHHAAAAAAGGTAAQAINTLAWFQARTLRRVSGVFSPLVFRFSVFRFFFSLCFRFFGVPSSHKFSPKF